ncbi:surface-associated interspersed protein (SURFIN) [Plasmodium gallinaceum]|uniref:Surface-associated interspersed protein (SURFIN) n=1 Tax=Plasmodium gallinaceum TaxID=5849 RepID=A0A1J1GQ42_PLAGA|nr:surface-associated interspersed protein (SURFIN) [Plasmodium gallinaceum]CRG94547.1 surface-associated interspersed protein (SURFIN) [Plasmodium gallinaceum]
MLCNIYFLFIWQLCILIKITISQEIKNSEKSPNLKEQIKGNNNELPILVDEIQDENEIKKLLLYLKDISDTSQDVSPDFYNKGSNLQDTSSDLQNLSEDLQDIMNSEDMIPDFFNEESNLQDTSSDLQNLSEDLQDIMNSEDILNIFNEESNLQDTNSNLQNLSEDLQDIFNSEDMIPDFFNEKSNLQDTNSDLQNLSEDLQDILNSQDMSSNFHNEETNLQDTSSDLQHLIEDLQDIILNSQNVIHDFKKEESNLQGTSYELEKNIFCSQDINYLHNSLLESGDTSCDLHQVEPTLFQNINFEGLYPSLQDYISSQNNTSSLDHNTSDSQDMLSISQHNTINSQNDISCIQNHISNLERTTYDSENINSESNKIHHNLPCHTTDSQNRLANLGETFDLNNIAPYLQDSDHHLRDSSHMIKNSSNASTSKCSYDKYTTQEKRILLKRKQEEESENNKKKKKKNHDDEYGINLKDESFTSNLENNIVRSTDIKLFALNISKNIFKMESSELSQSIIPHLRKIFEVLKEKYNIIRGSYNSNINILKNIIERELKNADEEDLNKIKLHYVYINEHNYHIQKKLSVCSLPFKNKLKKPFTNLHEIFNSLDTIIKIFEDLQKKITLYINTVKMISKVINEFTFNRILFGTFLLPSNDEIPAFLKMFKSIKNTLECIEKSLTTLSLNMYTTYNPQSYINSALNDLGLTRAEMRASTQNLKEMNISSLDHIKMLQIIFHFLQETNENNRNKLKIDENNLFMKEVIEIVLELLLKEEKYISESCERTCAFFNINSEEMNVSKTSFGSLLRSKAKKDIAHNLHISLMKLVRYSSYRTQHNKVESVYKTIRKMLSKKNIECLSKKTHSSQKLRNEFLVQLKILKDEINDVELNVVYKSLYNALKSDISSLHDLMSTITDKNYTLLTFLRKIHKAFARYLSKKEMNEKDNGHMEIFLHLLYYTNNLIDEFLLEELK